MLADALIDTGSLENAKVLVITGNLNRDALVIKLEAAGAIVDTFKVYENVRPDPAGDPAAENSVSGRRCRSFREFVGSACVRRAGAALKLADGAGVRGRSIGPRTSEAIRKAGIASIRSKRINNGLLGWPWLRNSDLPARIDRPCSHD